MYCGNKPGFCGKREDCPDSLCEGKPFPTRRSIGLEQGDGGRAIDTDLYEDDAFLIVLCQVLLVGVTVACVALVFIAWLGS